MLITSMIARNVCGFLRQRERQRSFQRLGRRCAGWRSAKVWCASAAEVRLAQWVNVCEREREIRVRACVSLRV